MSLTIRKTSNNTKYCPWVKCLISIAVLFLLIVIGFCILYFTVIAPFKHPALTKEIFDALEFQLDGKPYYEAIDIWPESTGRPDLSLIEKHEESKSKIENLKNTFGHLKSNYNSFIQHLNNQQDILPNLPAFSTLKTLDDTVISTVTYPLGDFKKIFLTPSQEKIDLGKSYLTIFYDAHFFGRYYKIRKVLFKIF